METQHQHSKSKIKYNKKFVLNLIRKTILKKMHQNETQNHQKNDEKT